MLRSRRNRIVSAAGIALAVLFPFVTFPTVELSSDIVKLALTGILAWLAFGVQKRSLGFFHIRGFGWRDLGAMFVAMICGLELVFVTGRLIEHFGAAGPSETGDAIPVSLAAGLVTAFVAGITEEFIYRGFIIEELGELLRNRRVAGAISILAFCLAHYGSGYGWSATLLYPGLFGLVITVLYFWRRNLPICMLMHVILDALHEIATHAAAR